MSDGATLIAWERRRQISDEGWTPAHDDGHAYGEMALAAACYALPDVHRAEMGINEPEFGGDGSPRLWPWGGYWKPTPDDRVRELVKAGALIAAEIDRLKRKDDES